MVITPTDIIYINRRNNEKWELPLKIVTKCGYERKFFFLVIRQKCGSEKGLYTYAFMCEKANELFDVFVKNRFQGKHQEELPPPTEPPTSTSPPPFPLEHKVC